MNVARSPRAGYIKAPNPLAEARRKYPFDRLSVGEMLDPPYPWEERHRVKAAVLRWNRLNRAALHVSFYPEGFQDSGSPCVVVGWPEDGVFVEPKPRKRYKQASVPMTNPAQNTSKA